MDEKSVALFFCFIGFCSNVSCEKRYMGFVLEKGAWNARARIHNEKFVIGKHGGVKYEYNRSCK